MKASTTALLSTLSLLPSLIASMPTPQPVSDSASYVTDIFGLIATHSTSPIHLQTINATGETFWINKPTHTECALDSGCPPGNTTAFHWYNNTLSLDTEVPGGQSVYVTPRGILGFTQAHSASAPSGADFDNFAYTPAASEGGLGSLTYTGQGASGFIACPSTSDAGTVGTQWQIFADVAGLGDADVPGGNVSACLGLDALTPLYNGHGPAAWEYA